MNDEQKEKMNIFEKYPKSKYLNGLPIRSDLIFFRERIINLFGFLDGLEDPHFEQQLDQDPHAQLWEMMLAKILKSEGYKPTRAKAGPDFVVEKDGKRIFIEAICVGPGEEDNPNSVPQIVCEVPIAPCVPVEQIVLRICSALRDKKLKYDNYLKKGIVSESDICIIAVSTSKIGHASSGLYPPVIMRATHGLGNQYVVFTHGEEAVEEGIEQCKSILKVGVPDGIDTTFFLSGANNLISAILYSGCSFFSLGFDLFGQSKLIHNPKAHVSLNPGFLKQYRRNFDRRRGYPSIFQLVKVEG
ncbi:MAG: hypothetical protein C0399_09820 [Syntrophus sp. (in: bacteria)]|nr:hypothetical protein [Syntrophus sp. (in: bacteria)]